MTQTTIVVLAIWMLCAVLKLEVTSASATPATTLPAEGGGVASTVVNDFACDLYAKLAAGNAGENLFFSPFSMASALAMTAEGARRQTADEMGRVLRLPNDARTGAPDRPWDMTRLHEVLGSLHQRLGGKPVPDSLRQRIEALRADLDAANRKLESSRSFDDAMMKLQRTAQATADELNGLLKQVDQYELRSANALWGEKTFDFERDYLDGVARFYKTGGLFPVDFRSDPDGSRQRINDWVSQQTRDRIKDLIKQGQITPETRLVLTNAIYFKGEWSEPFEAKQTSDDNFATIDGSSVRVPLMHDWAKKDCRYAAINADGTLFDTPEKIERGETDRSKLYPSPDGFQLCELPYKGGDLSMVVILPQSIEALPKLESRLNGASLAAWLSRLSQRKVEVFLPKFRLETDYDMVATLESLGMRRAFVNPIDVKNGAEFDGISSSSDPSKRLFIGAVIHKAFIDVNEKGTEAAAATAVIGLAGSAAHQMVPFTPVFRADRPFILIIRERASGTVLFMGRVTRPA